MVSDFLFLDPPYRMRGEYERTLGYLSYSRLLQPSTSSSPSTRRSSISTSASERLCGIAAWIRATQR